MIIKIVFFPHFCNDIKSGYILTKVCADMKSGYLANFDEQSFYFEKSGLIPLEEVTIFPFRILT